MQVGVIGINYKLADLKLRELLAKACQKRFGANSSLHAEHAFILLSTCNRTEIYFTSNDLTETHTYILNILRSEVDEDFDHKLYSFFGNDCFSHLARVTAGLDSAIVGETEIQGQVKNAYETTMQYTDLPSDLHYLFQKALKIGKQVRSDLQIGRGVPDLEHAVLQIGSHLFKQPKSTKILFVGASEINQKILGFFRSKGIEDITLCNRTHDTTYSIAQEHNLKILSWENISQWQEYDWIVFGTKSPDYLLKKEDISKACVSQKLVIDLCVPRNVEPLVGKEPGITLLNIDQINRTLKIRRKQLNKTLARAESVIVEASQKQASLLKEKQKSRLQFLVG